MDASICRSLAASLETVPQKIAITWHGGEPLALKKSSFIQLLDCFEDLRSRGQIEHVIQTNATLIDAEWCSLFRTYNVHVGVSLDGDRPFNSGRLTRGGQSSFDSTMAGIAVLRENEIPFTIIAVVGPDTISHAEALYEFFATTGCRSLGINFADVLNANSAPTKFADVVVRKFWTELFQAWKKRPAIGIREFAQGFSWVRAVLDGADHGVTERWIDLFPTVDVNGNVSLLSPEFVNAGSVRYANFVVGNLREKDLLEILDRYGEIAYVRDFYSGRLLCEQTCQYYGSCGGGNAANKYFELGTTEGTMTNACRRSVMLMIDTILD